MVIGLVEEPSTRNSPTLTVVAQAYELEPDWMSVPHKVLARLPVPVIALFTFRVSAALETVIVDDPVVLISELMVFEPEC